jgi:plasmid stability protein
MAGKSVMIQIRNVPAKVHRILKARAALAGKSLSDYLLDDLKRSVEKPSMEEWLAKLRTQEPVDLGDSIVDMIREDRER